MEIETQCLYAGYSPKNGEPQTLPICQSTTFKYESTEQVSKLFDLEEAGFFYTRLGNPTVDAVEQKIAMLEGGVGALCTASGQAATTFSILTLAAAGDHIVSSSAIYGGSLNLFAVTLKRLGIEVTFVSPEASEDEIQAAFRPNTKALFGETIANPSIEVLDIEKFARIAHRNGVPLIVDNTFATPVLCRPIEFGADIVVHSTTKYMDGHALQMGGVIVDGGTFDWTNGKFPEFTEPDDSYHGTIYTQAFGKAAYIVKARTQIMRDMGACQTPFGAFLINQGLETLPLRIVFTTRIKNPHSRCLRKYGFNFYEFIRFSYGLKRISPYRCRRRSQTESSSCRQNQNFPPPPPWVVPEDDVCVAEPPEESLSFGFAVRFTCE